MKEIPVSQIYKMLVDDSDYVWLSKFKWWIWLGYAATTIHLEGKLHHVKAHHMLLGKRKGFVTDHINRNKLDNRRDNLRFVTNDENTRNTFRKDNKTGYVCVSKRRNGDPSKPWVAGYRLNGFKHHLGCFATMEEAAAAYESVKADPTKLPGLVKPRWTDEEKALLNRYKELGYKKIALLTGRTEATVRQIAHQKGLSK